MELRHLRAFVAVAEEEHFSRAAARLNISQPPLSAAVRELERELGVALFERTTRSVAITGAGAALLEHARAALRSIEAMQSAAALTQTGLVGRVRAGFAGTSGYRLLARIVSAVRERAPGIRVELVPQTYSGDAVEAVLGGDLDLAFTGFVPPKPLSSFIIGRESLVLAVPEGHPLAAHAEIDPRELHDVPLVMYPDAQGSAVRRSTAAILDAAGARMEVAAEAPDPFSLLALVAAGVGAAVVADHAGLLEVSGVHYRPFVAGAAAQIPLRLVWHRAARSAALDQVVAIARELHGGSAVGAVQQ